MTATLNDLMPARPDLVIFRPDESHLEGFLPSFGTPEGVYSRTCWLPVLGPTSWVLWGTVARELDDTGPAIYRHDELTRALGLGRPERLLKALRRLDRFGIASNPTNNPDASWLLPTVSPPLWNKHHHLLDPHACEFHRRWSNGLDETNWHNPLQVDTSHCAADHDHDRPERTES